MPEHGFHGTFGLVSDPPLSGEGGAPYGALTPYFRDLIERALGDGWNAYVFSAKDVLKQRKMVWGWTRSQGTWQRAFFPVPDVAYPRFRSLAKDEYAILEWLKDTCGTQFLTQLEVEQMVADRWRLFQICLSHPTLSKRVPDSFLLRDRISLEAVLTEYPALLALSRSEQRTNRLAVLRRQGDEWLINLEHQGKQTTERFRSIVRLRVLLSDLFDETVLQPYAEPLRLDECPVSIRSFWQRGGDTRWHETATIVRVGQPGAIGSTLATAGLLSQFQPLLRASLGKRVQALEYELHAAAQSVVELIDQRGHGAGELAVDFAINRDGSIALRSASTLGGSSALRRLNDPALRQAALLQTLGYARALHREVFAASEGIPVIPQSVGNS